MDNSNSNRFREYLDKFKIPIALSLVGVVLIIGGAFFSGSNSSKVNNFPKESIIQSQKVFAVDVSGAVQNPAVYKLKEGDRIEEAISAAGGFSDGATGRGKANKEYISKYLNMAQKLSDGSKVYVPFEGESGPKSGGQGGVVAGINVQTKVNVNTATQAELEALPGIGPVTASKIISDRPYQKVDDLLNKKIVNKSTFEKIKDQLVVYY